jgi:hypothetical protein
MGHRFQWPETKVDNQSRNHRRGLKITLPKKYEGALKAGSAFIICKRLSTLTTKLQTLRQGQRYREPTQ